MIIVVECEKLLLLKFVIKKICWKISLMLVTSEQREQIIDRMYEIRYFFKTKRMKTEYKLERIKTYLTECDELQIEFPEIRKKKLRITFDVEKEK